MNEMPPKNSLMVVLLTLMVLCGIGQAEEALPIPAPGAEAVVLPYFAWPAAEVAFYHLYLGLSPNSLVRIADTDAARNEFYYGPGLMARTTYYWRVDLESTVGGKVVGPIWSFTTQGLDAYAPSPANGQWFVSQTPVLQWTPGPTAFEQDLYLGTDLNAVIWADTGWPEYRCTLGGWGYRYQSKVLDPNTTYFWRVDAVELTGAVHAGSVWSFTTLPRFEVHDPNLKAWWRCDEGQGQTLLDGSGHEQHCALESGLWVPGRSGLALACSGDTPPAEGAGSVLPVGEARFTLAAWLCPQTWVPEQALVWWGKAEPGMGNGLFLYDSRLGHTFGQDRYSVDLGPSLGEWTHVAVTHLGAGHRRIFINGTPQVGVLEGTLPQPRVVRGSVLVGGLAWPRTDAGFHGTLDDLRIYDRVLPETEIQALVYDDSLLAGPPLPSDRSIVDIEQALSLSWGAVSGVWTYEIYFGSDHDQVTTAANQTAGVYLGPVQDLRFTPPGSLDLGRTYYWRVDSQLPDGSLARGDLWRFTVADYLVVDDFESYTDAAADLIFLAWHDGLGYDDPKDGFPGNGSGSTVGHLEVPYAEQSIVHSGSQAMPLYYNNQDSVGFSQADRTYTSPSDWTRRGVRHLQVHFAGQPGNTLGVSDTLYVRLVDQEGREFIQHYTDAGGAGALQVTEWQSWSIPLSAVNQQGLNLHSLTRLSLGIGDPLAPQAGGTGIVYIDDIRLTID